MFCLRIVTSYQCIGFLYGTYEIINDVPLGIRARVAAFYEPPQESTKNSIKLLENHNDALVQEMAAALGLQKVSFLVFL
jgi:nuclear protein localization family protein 4